MRFIELPPVNQKVLRYAWAKVKILPDGCWEWQGGFAGKYADFCVEGVSYRAHRLFYAWFKAPIEEGLCIDHLCRNMACVNPDHLEAVTQAVNIQRCKGKYCKRGHPLSDPNLYHYLRMGKPARRCLSCLRMPAESLAGKG